MCVIPPPQYSGLNLELCVCKCVTTELLQRQLCCSVTFSSVNFDMFLMHVLRLHVDFVFIT